MTPPLRKRRTSIPTPDWRNIAAHAESPETVDFLRVHLGDWSFRIHAADALYLVLQVHEGVRVLRDRECARLQDAIKDSFPDSRYKGKE